MTSAANRRLGVFSLATLLVSAHYGLGFILGTAEQAMAKGAGGSLYAVSLGLGFLALLALAKFYWSEVEQIWTLLGNRYGKPVKVGVGLMSWTSLIGIEAVQMIAAASILSVAGIPKSPGTIALAIVFCILSLLPVERASWVFRGLLLFNILALLFALWRLQSLPELWQTPLAFISALRHVDVQAAIGVSVATILLVLIDMKCQQFVVQAKDIRTAYWGCILAAIALIGLAFLPTTVAIAGQNMGILPANVTGKEAIPYSLSWIGGGANQPWGIVLMLALAVPALGIGSNILRIQTKTVLDLEVIPNTQQNRILLTILNVLFAFGIALKDGEIISLILYFYAVYLSTVWIPFAAYLLAHTRIYVFSDTSVRLSFFIGALTSLSALAIALFYPKAIVFNSAELTIMVMGMGFGSLSLLAVQMVEKYLLVPKTQTQQEAQS
jgi:SSS family solute:Na+ symporter